MRITGFVPLLIAGLSGCSGEDLSHGSKADFSEAFRKTDSVSVPRNDEQRADRVSGALILAGERKVDSPNRIMDVAMTAKVRSALIAEPGLKSLSIHVKSVGGLITLSGKTETRAASEQAVRVVSAVPGVQFVQSKLQVTGS